MNVLSFTILITSLLAVGSCSFIEYDVNFSEMSGDHEMKSEESAIFLDESYLSTTPPSVVMDYEEPEEVETNEFVGRTTVNLTDTEYKMAFGKEEHHPDEHINFDLGFGAGLVNSKDWTGWTCCRPVVFIQSRERVQQSSRNIEMQFKKCSSNYCVASDCVDNVKICTHFIRTMGIKLCEKTNPMSTFMSHHCPQTCNFCGENTIPTPAPTRPASTLPWWMTSKQPRTTPWWETTTTQRPRTTPYWETTTTRRPRPTPWWMTTTKSTTVRPTPWWMTTTKSTTTQAPAYVRPSKTNMVKVTILKHMLSKPFASYKFINGPVRVRSPWRRIRQNSPELASFYLYKRPTDTFKVQIRFCMGRDGNGHEKWTITKRLCSTGAGWTEEFVLYGSLRRQSNSQLYYVGNRGKPLWSASISDKFDELNNGFRRSIFYFYGPKSPKNPTPTWPKPSTTPRPWTPTPSPWTRPTITQRPFPTTTQRTRPTRPPTGPQPTDSYNKECLEAHNFFRAVHNVPLLQWDPELAKTSQTWANQLKMIAPERPDQLKIPSRRTPNWPHSQSGTGNRNRGDGENIAWDLSQDGSPAKESVLRWYSEIFYYNRNHPTYSASDKPVGHLTQMLWKDTTHLGCAMAVTTLPKYRQQSTWSVAHYSPGGNIRYGNSAQMTLQLYNKQVPDFRSGSCMTKSGRCSNGNQCAAFGPAQGSCSCNSGLASCRSNGGCIAWCKNQRGKWPWKEECQGNRSCECTKSGAVCDGV